MGYEAGRPDGLLETRSRSQEAIWDLEKKPEQDMI